MASPAIHLDTAESDPATHQGYAAVIRDLLVTDATSRFGRPGMFATPHALPMGATPRTDVAQSGVSTAMADLTLRTDLDQLGMFVEGMRERLVERWNEQHEKNRLASERIAKLESLVQERDAEIDMLRRRTTKAEGRLTVIEDHNDQIANAVQALVWARESLLDLAKHAPALLALVEG